MVREPESTGKSMGLKRLRSGINSSPNLATYTQLATATVIGTDSELDPAQIKVTPASPPRHTRRCENPEPTPAQGNLGPLQELLLEGNVQAPEQKAAVGPAAVIDL